MADVNRGNRPLSPHLSIYRPQLTSMTSILTRITGNAMLVAALLIVWWFLAAATSESYFAVANGFLTSWFGDLVLFLSLLGHVVSHARGRSSLDLGQCDWSRDQHSRKDGLRCNRRFDLADAYHCHHHLKGRETWHS